MANLRPGVGPTGGPTAGGGGEVEAGEGTSKAMRWRVREYEQRRLAGALADATAAS